MCNISHSTSPGKKLAVSEVDYLERQEKSGEVDYIERKDRKRISSPDYGQDLAYTEFVNAPAWAIKGAAQNGERPSRYFFQCAMEYERKNATTYHEIEAALPQDLKYYNADETPNYSHYISMVKDIMKLNGLDDRPYLFAIHDKPAALSPNDRNIHVHIMWNGKIPGQHKRDTPKHYFKQYNSKNPALGGCKKDDRFSKKGQKERTAEMDKIRKNIETVINNHYKRHGYDYFVDCRTNEEQLQDAIARNDLNSAELLTLGKEEHLGEYQLRIPNSRKVEAALKKREMRRVIIDRQLLEKAEEKEFSEGEISFSDSNEEQVRAIESRMKEIETQMGIILFKMRDIDEVEDAATVKIEEINNKIIDAQQKMATDISKSAMMLYFREQCKGKQFLEYQSKKNNLTWHKGRITQKEKYLQTKNATGRTISREETKYVAALKRTAQILEAEIKVFEEEHIDKIPSLEIYTKKAEENKKRLENFVRKLQERRKELEENPLLLEILTQKDKLLTEKENILCTKEEFDAKPEPRRFDIEGTQQYSLEKDRLTQLLTDCDNKITTIDKQVETIKNTPFLKRSTEENKVGLLVDQLLQKPDVPQCERIIIGLKEVSDAFKHQINTNNRQLSTATYREREPLRKEITKLKELQKHIEKTIRSERYGANKKCQTYFAVGMPGTRTRSVGDGGNIISEKASQAANMVLAALNGDAKIAALVAKFQGDENEEQWQSLGMLTEEQLETLFRNAVRENTL